MTEKLVQKLIKMEKQISTMESCTGGALASEITSVEGASEILKFSAITYSNEFKIKMGVSENLIKSKGVYNIEVAEEMSKNIAFYTNADIGIGITGKINRIDPNNKEGENNLIYVSIYLKDEDKYYNEVIKAIPKSRKENKKYIVDKIINDLLVILNDNN